MRKNKHAANGGQADQGRKSPEATSKDYRELRSELFQYLNEHDESALDVGTVDAYLERLQEIHPVLTESDPEAETARIIAHIRRQEPPQKHSARKRRPGLRVAIVAAAVVAVLTVGITARWAFDRVFMRQNQSGELTIPDGVNAEYHSFQEALDLNGFDVPAAPAWIPADLAFSHVEVRDSGETKRIVGYFYGVERKFRIQITDTAGGDTASYAETLQTVSPRIYAHNDIEYKLYINTNTTKVYWTIGNYICMISGSLTEKELEAIIDSIT